MPVISYVDPKSLVLSVIEFDVITEETHQLGAVVSDHPVERGAPISDHVRPELLRLTIKGVVSDTPINAVTAGIGPGPLLGSMIAHNLTTRPSRLERPMEGTPAGVPPFRILGLRPAVVPATVTPAEYRNDVQTVSGGFLQFPERLSRVRTIFQTLERVCTEAIALEITTDVRTYSSMLITAINCSRDGTTSLEFSMSLRELRTVTTAQTTVQRTVRAKPKPAEVRAEPETNKGKQAEPFKLNTRKSVSKTGIEALTKTGEHRGL